MEYLIIILIVSLLYIVIPSKNELCGDTDIDGGTYGKKPKAVRKRTRKKTAKTKTLPKKVKKKTIKKKTTKRKSK